MVMTFSDRYGRQGPADSGAEARARKRILIVDADRAHVGALASQLHAYGFVPVLSTGDTWMDAVDDDLAGVVIGPRLLPLEVAKLCRRVRANTLAPLIAFMDAGGAEHMSLVLDSGADHTFVADLNTSARLVISGIGVVKRREEQFCRSGESAITLGRLRIDLDRRVVELDGAIVPLTTTEFSILALLAQNPGRVMAAADILQQVHGYRVADDEAQDIVKVHISRLRQKLAVDGNSASALINVRGQGYMYMIERRGETREQLSRGDRTPDRRGEDGRMDRSTIDVPA